MVRRWINTATSKVKQRKPPDPMISSLMSAALAASAMLSDNSNKNNQAATGKQQNQNSKRVSYGGEEVQHQTGGTSDQKPTESTAKDMGMAITQQEGC